MFTLCKESPSVKYVALSVVISQAKVDNSILRALPGELSSLSDSVLSLILAAFWFSCSLLFLQISSFIPLFLHCLASPLRAPQVQIFIYQPLRKLPYLVIPFQSLVHTPCQTLIILVFIPNPFHEPTPSLQSTQASHSALRLSGSS